MSELKERLERLGELGTPAGADVIWRRVSHRLAPDEVGSESIQQRRDRRTPVVVAVSLAVVVALLVAGVVILNRATSGSHPSVVAGPTPSSTQAALDSEHTQTLLASTDTQRGIEVTNVDAGTTETAVPGPMSLVPCNTCPLVRRGDAVFFARDGRAYVLEDPHGSPRDLGPASFVFSGSDNRTVWTATTTRDSGAVSRLDEHGNPTGGPWTIPAGYRISLNFLPKEIAGRILLARGLNPPRVLYAWGPEGGKRMHLGDVLFTVDTYRRPGASEGALAWIPQASCRSGLRRCALTLTNVSAKGTPTNKRTIDPPGDSNGFIGGGAFSPDGRTLAAFVEATPTQQGPAARLVLVDVASGAVHEVRGGQISIGESYGFANWDSTGRWLFFGGFPEHLLVHRAGTDDAVALNLPASYTSVALAAPPPPTPATTTPTHATAATADLRDVQNLGPSAARRKLESDGLTVAIEYRTDRVNPGRILEQRPAPGTRVSRGDQVVLVVDAFQPCGGFFHPTALPKDFDAKPRPGPAPEAAAAGVPDGGFELHYTDGRGRSIEIRRPATPAQADAGDAGRPADAYVLGQAVTMLQLESGRTEPLIARFFFPTDQPSDPCGSYSINGYGVSKREMRLFAESLTPNP
jgi:PASTA domain